MGGGGVLGRGGVLCVGPKFVHCKVARLLQSNQMVRAKGTEGPNRL